MSLLWDPRKRQPQVWVYPFFFILTLIIFIVIWNYGAQRMLGKKTAPSAQQ